LTLVVRRGPDLVRREFERDLVPFVARRELEAFPVHRDLAVADAQETAEIDHRRDRLAILSHQYVG